MYDTRALFPMLVERNQNTEANVKTCKKVISSKIITPNPNVSLQQFYQWYLEYWHTQSGVVRGHSIDSVIRFSIL